MAIACVDWREANRDDVARLYAGEIGRWSVALGWATDASWEHIELGRRLGSVPGLLALDGSGAIAGWTFFILHQGCLQIGGFAALSEEATIALVRGIFESEAAAAAQSATVFVFSDAPGLAGALARRGLTVGAYDYLLKPLTSDAATADAGPRAGGRRHPPPELDWPPTAPPPRQWRASDREAVAALLASAYPGADVARPFASRGTSDEWMEYVGQLVGAAGVGTLMPGSCYVLPAGADRVSGVVLVTRLAPATAHIAQLAVDPGTHRRGLGRRLVDLACASASAAGCDRMTLLVDARNVPARRLYEERGFRPVAPFLSAGCGQPLRLNSVAVGRGAATRLP